MRAAITPLLALMLLVGCGGDGGSSTPPPPATVKGANFQIVWPERTRSGLEHGLTSAQSVKVTLPGAAADGGDVVLTTNREADQNAAHTSTVEIPQPIRTSVNSLSAVFYAEANGEGAVVGTANAEVSLSNDKLNLASITVVGKVAMVKVIDTDALTLNGGTRQLAASAKTVSGDNVAISAGSIKWTVTGGEANLSVTPDGMATPLAVGMATVTATVDGIVSEPATIRVKAGEIGEPNFRIVWPARTRGDIEHPFTAALSAKVILHNATGQGGDVTVVVNRDPSKLDAHTETYSVGRSIAPTVSSVTAIFYAQPDAGGAEVGTASGVVTPDGDRLDIGTLELDGRIRGVEVITADTIQVGGPPVQLLASALNTSGPGAHIIPVTPGSFRWNITSGVNNLSITPDGMATGLAPGKASVTATVNGVTSAPVTITVVGSGPTLQIVHVRARELRYNKATGLLWANVGEDGGEDANSLVAVDPSTGNVTKRIPFSNVPWQFAISEDGTYAFVWFPADKTVQRVDLATKQTTATYPISETEVSEVLAVPGRSDMFLLAGAKFVAYKDGIRLGETGTSGATNHFATGSSSIIYSGNVTTLFENRLTENGLQLVSQKEIYVKGFQVSGDVLYTSKGSIVDPVTKAVVGQLDASDLMTDKNLAIREDEDRIYFVTWNFVKPKRIVTFEKSSGTVLSVFNTEYKPGGALDVVATGDHTVAFKGSGASEDIIGIVRGLP